MVIPNLHRRDSRVSALRGPNLAAWTAVRFLERPSNGVRSRESRSGQPQGLSLGHKVGRDGPEGRSGRCVADRIAGSAFAIPYRSRWLVGFAAYGVLTFVSAVAHAWTAQILAALKTAIHQ